MIPNTDRPEASLIDGKVHVFVGGYRQVMTVPAAEILMDKIAEAVAKARSSEEPKS